MSATERIKLVHELRAPADEVDIVPGVHSTLLSGVNFADANYVTILDKEGIHIYDRKTAEITILEKAFLSGYRTSEVLWRIPLKKNVQYINTDTLLIQRPLSKEDIYHVL